MLEQTTPIFLFSLPRSGSTLLQRILATHQQIATVSEPWFLLPLLYTMKQSGVYAEYAHYGIHRATHDLYQTFPNQKDDYYQAIRDFSLQIYAHAATNKDSTYFLDKTPRYHLIAENIVEIFPDAKFIFLWRNPLAIVASIIETWGNGRWNLHRYKIDLFRGLANLIKTYQTVSDRSISIQYETLVTDGNLGATIFNYLNLDYSDHQVPRFHQVQLGGSLGNKKEVDRLEIISESLDKWTEILNSPLRKRWCSHYLTWIGEERLNLMGYDYYQLQEELSTLKTNIKPIGLDSIDMCLGAFQILFEPQILKHKIKHAKSWQEWYLHL